MAVAAVARSLRAGDGEYEGSLEETVAQIEKDGCRALALPYDLGDPDRDRAALVERAAAELGGPVTVLVHAAAGPLEFDRMFPDMTREAFARGVEINVWAGWDLAVAAVPGMREAGAGWILFVSSTQAGPRVLYAFRDHVSDTTWLRPYVGAGAHVLRASVNDPVTGLATADTGMAAQFFGGTELTLAAVPRLGLSADVGYQWYRSPFVGYTLDGMMLTVSAHWYLK